jgi:hypothetical protein
VKAVSLTATCTVNRSAFGLPLCPRFPEEKPRTSHERFRSRFG